MEYQFKETKHRCMQNLFSQTQTMEQTAEVRLSGQNPPAERIIGAWGQPVLRSKEWQPGEMTVSAGLMVWVLYSPEEGGEPVCVDSWIPFTFRWDLPRELPEGKLRVSCLCGGVDARLVSLGKILIRGNLSVLSEGWGSSDQNVYAPDELPEQVQLLRSEYPLRLPVEAGERVFDLDEELTLPASVPEPEKLICCQLHPTISDCRILAGKLVFRGNANAHILYRGKQGQFHSWEFEVPFSQYVQLEAALSVDAGAMILPVVTGMETDLDSEGRFHLKAQLTAQYVAEDQRKLSVTEDAYLPGGELKIRQEMLELPAVLDRRSHNFSGEQMLAGEGDVVVDAMVLPEYPRVRRIGDGVTVELSGICQVLYYDTAGQLRCTSHRWEESHSLKAHEDAKLLAIPSGQGMCQVMNGNGSLAVQYNVPAEVTVLSGQGIPMITALELETDQKKDPQRPSLILRRAEQGLWELAKESGSTMDAIRKANQLEQEPVPGQMLLIPVL